MDEEDINFGIEEYSRTRDVFTQIALQSLLRSDEVEEGYTIKKLDLFISLTTLSVAFLTIVIPLTRSSLPASTLSIWMAILFLITSISGILLSILTIKRKIKITKEDSTRKHKIFNGFISEAVDIILGMQDYKKNRKHEIFEAVRNKMEELENSRKNLHIDEKKWHSEKEKECLAIVLKYLETIFWAAFSFANVLFIVWLFQASSAIIR